MPHGFLPSIPRCNRVLRSDISSILTTSAYEYQEMALAPLNRSVGPPKYGHERPNHSTLIKNYGPDVSTVCERVEAQPLVCARASVCEYIVVISV